MNSGQPPKAITRLVPRAGPVDQARLLVAAARYNEALQLLEGVDGIAAAAIRIRALARLGRPDDAVAEFDRSQGQLESGETPRERALFFAYGARVLDKVDQRAAAETAITRARREVSEDPDINVLAEIDYYDALVTSSRDPDFDVAPLLERALGSDSARLRAQALEYQAIHPSFESNRDRQLAIFERALAAIMQSPREDEYLAANLLWNTSNLALETLNREILHKLAHRMLLIRWSDALERHRFLLLRTASLARSLEGDYLQSVALIDEAARSAPIGATRLMAFTDRLQLDIERDGNTVTKDHVATMVRMAETIGSKDRDPLDRSALLHAVEVVAHADTDAALRLMQKYAGMKDAVGHQRFLDRFSLGEEAYAVAIIDMRRGRWRNAALNFSSCFDRYKAVSLRKEATNAALHLLQLGQATEEHRSYLASIALAFPRSPAAVKARELLTENDYAAGARLKAGSLQH
jgi:hypothetical protein